MKSRLLTMVAILTSLASLPAFGLDLARGQRLYNMHCASCHGLNGMPVMPNLPNFAMRQGLDNPDFELMQIVLTGINQRTGKSHLPPFIGMIKEPELADVIQYIRVIR